MKKRIPVILGLVVAALAVPRVASAFCGFYVSGAGTDLYNNATQVVLMREGTRTVLSMQNNYTGPPQNFAMVVPVPVVLQEENVKTLPTEVFQRLDQLTAPRLVEYWEQDPCQQLKYEQERAKAMAPMATGAMQDDESDSDLGVTIEAQFDVGEYQVVILSASESTGLDTWLKKEGYKIPDGAEPFLRPYVEAGSKFFVAKVDVAKVKFESGRATLSPLRFHYDSEDFSLPVRLGLMNAKDKQDLIVHILAMGQRYEVSNFKNVTIPTNLDVVDAARERFGEFYAALFDRTLEKNPGSVVTEYSWDASSCDPCPVPALNWNELATFGYDVLHLPATEAKKKVPGKPDAVDELLAKPRVAPPMPPPPPPRAGFVVTRLHARYSVDSLGEDLVFAAAPPIAGGREMIGQGGKLEEGSVAASMNNFQARYAIRHEWTGPVECKDPVRGVWGGPPAGEHRATPKSATDLAFVPRGKTKLATMVRTDIPEIGVTAGKPAAGASAGANPATGTEASAQGEGSGAADKKKKKGCGCAAGEGSTGGLLLLALAGLVLARRRRRIS